MLCLATWRYLILQFHCSGRRVGAGGSTRYDRTPGSSGMTPMYGSRTPMYGSQTPLHDGSRTPHYGSQTPSHEPGSMTPGRAGAWDPTVSNTPARLSFLLSIFRLFVSDEI